ncbi:MAG TPA: glycosyltransferase family 2 protein [Acidimicrobiales bacterium]|nr:glycosyltransferase family 2 protein [Acidimicrobiales bacterium]
MAEGAAVAAVVVNRDGGDSLLGCVESLRAAGVEQVVVVDNASSDGSPARLVAADPAARLVPTGENLGYGRAANRGAARTEAPYLLVCNPDLVAHADAVKVLVAELEQRPEVAAVGPKILDVHGAVYPSARAIPSLVTGAGHALLAPFFPDNPWTRSYRLAEADPGSGREVDWVSGAFLLLRRVAFESVGGFDERYFMYVEDLDLCWRLGRAGWKVRYAPEAVIVHEQGQSAARHPLRMLAAHHRSTWRFECRHARGLERALLPVIGLALLARLGVTGVRELARGRTERPERQG